MPPLTYDELARLEPALAALELLVRRAAPAAAGDHDNMVFLREVKPVVLSLVGWDRPWDDADDARLYSTYAYDIVYQRLLALIGGREP